MSKPSKPDRHSEREPAPAPAASVDNAVWDALSGRRGSRWARGPGRRGVPAGYVGGDQVGASDVTFDSQQAARERAQTQLPEQAQLEQQAVPDEEPPVPHEERHGLIDSDPNTVTEALRDVFQNDAVTVLGTLADRAVLVVVCPELFATASDTDVSSRTRRREIRHARAETRSNDLAVAALAKRVLAAAGRALSTAPTIGAVTCVGVRPTPSNAGEPVYVGTFQRAYAERLLAEGLLSSYPDTLRDAIEEAEDVNFAVTAQTHRITALNVSNDPGLAAVMSQMDPSGRSDESAALASDQDALKTFLSAQDVQADEEHADRWQEAESDVDRSDHEPSSFQPEESAQSRIADPPRTDDALGVVATEGGDPFSEALTDNDRSVRRAAVEAISRRNDPNDTPLLLKALRDSDEAVQLDAMYALKDRLGTDSRRDVLAKACHDSDATVRREAIEPLAELGDEGDTPLLLEALKDPDDQVRLEAIYAVRHRLEPDMRGALIDSCGDVDENVRRKALEAVADIGDERDTALLLTALKDPGPSVRLEATYALERRLALGSPAALERRLLQAIKEENASVRKAAVRLLGRLDRQRGPRADRAAV